MGKIVNSKKLLTLISIVILILALTACSADKAPNNQADSNNNNYNNKAEVKFVDQGIYPAEITREGSVVNITMYTTQNQIEIAKDTFYQGWTFDGTVPGPVLRVNEGDTVNFTLVNKDTQMPHSMDFHAAKTPWDRSYVDVEPGESFTYTFEAEIPGVYMYHCGTSPVLAHIANGMYGAIIVDPTDDQSFEIAREFVLVQSEFYKSASDLDDMMNGEARVVAFNGKAFKYDKENPLEAKQGELIRFYVVNAGPNNFSAFHIVGTIFDRVYLNGNPANVEYGVQTVTIPPGGSYVVELTVAEEGFYPIVTHSFKDAMKGATGFLRVTANAKEQPLAP